MQKSTLTWVAWNAVFAVAIYVGIWSDVPYVGYGVSAFVWLMLGLYLLSIIIAWAVAPRRSKTDDA